MKPLTDDIYDAISYLDRALNLLGSRDHVTNFERDFVKIGREKVNRSEKQLREVKIELGQRSYRSEPQDNYEHTSCYCYATPCPPCSYCTNQPKQESAEIGDFSEELPDRWKDRFAFDLNVSRTSPVVKGTWVTVGYIVSMIVNGWSWADLLRTHPEITEDDIRSALAYTVEKDDNDTATGESAC